MVISDSAAAISEHARALRASGTDWGRARKRRALVSGTMRLRRRLGLVAMLWVPSHQGVVPNAVADMVAGAYAEDWVSLRNPVDARPRGAYPVRYLVQGREGEWVVRPGTGRLTRSLGKGHKRWGYGGGTAHGGKGRGRGNTARGRKRRC